MSRASSRVRAGVVLSVPVLSVAGLLGAVAAPLPAAAAPPPAAGAASPPAARTLTLITGDRLSVRPGPAGPEVTTDPEPGREAPGLLVLRHGADVSAIPADALPLVAAGRLDPALFDIRTLLGRGLTDDRTASLPVRVDGAATTVAKRGAAEFFERLAARAHPPAVTLAGATSATDEPGAGTDPTVTVRVLDRRGAPAQDPYLVVLDADTGELLFAPDGAYHVAPGTHLCVTALVTEPGPDGRQSRSFVARPDVEVTQDATVTLDARTALPVGFTVADPRVVPVAGRLGFTRGPADGDPAATVTARYSDPRGDTTFYATPTGPVTHGVFRFEAGQTLAVPPLSAQVVGGGPLLTLHPVRPLRDDRLEGRRLVPVTTEPRAGSYLLLDAGDGTDQEALVRAAAAAGVAGIVLTGGTPPRAVGPLPVLLLGPAEADVLRTRIAAGPVRLRLHGSWFSPVRYDLQETRDEVPDQPQFAVWPGQLARLDEVVRTLGAPDDGVFTRSPAGYQPTPVPVAGGRHRTDWVSPGVTWAEDLNYGHVKDRFTGELYGWAAFWSQPPRTFRAGTRTAVTWLDEVIRPAAGGGGFGSRYGDVLIFPGSLFTDGSERPGDVRFLDRVSWRLSADGAPVAASDDPYPWSPSVPADDRLYTLSVDAARQNVPSWQRATRTHSTFTFPSGHAETQTPLPVLTLHPHLPLDDTNSAPAGSVLTFLVDTRGPAGTVIPASGLTLATRTGDGDWTPAAVERVDEDSFRVRVENPPVTGPVDLRLSATADGGVGSTLEVDAAYGLR